MSNKSSDDDAMTINLEDMKFDDMRFDAKKPNERATQLHFSATDRVVTKHQFEDGSIYSG